MIGRRSGRLCNPIDLSQVDHGGGREGGEGGGAARNRREWSTCVARSNLNRIKNFSANNFAIKWCDLVDFTLCVHLIQLLHCAGSGSMATNVTPTKTFSRIDISLSANETVCIEICFNNVSLCFSPQSALQFFSSIFDTKLYYFYRKT